MNVLRKFFVALVAAFALTAVALLLAWMRLQDYWYSEIITPESDSVFQVNAGASLGSVIRELRARELLDDPRIAKIALRVFQPDLTVKAGEYPMPTRTTRAELFELLASGISLNYSVTIVEGISAREALQVIQREQAKTVASDQATTLTDDPALLDQQLIQVLLPEALAMMPEQINPEGWFFPDTYRFVRGESASTILSRAHRRMLAVLAEEWPERQPELPFSTPYEALIMASLIEKETGAVEEREQIAGVFTRRLRIGMRLQTDPTIIYGIRDKYDGNITRKHLRSDTPYNTYTRGGLTPTPIALPGRGAIRAALNPADGDTLYFVAKGDGSHYFSKTLEEHRSAVRKYQILQRRSNYRSAPAKAASG